MKKVYFGLLLAVLLVCFCCAASADIAYGTCGENLTWNIDDSYTLTISGTGAMDNYNSRSFPWYNWRYDLKKVVINHGVTSIGSYAFHFCTGIYSFSIPSSVTDIYDHAFEGNKAAMVLDLPEGVKRIHDCAFDITMIANISLPLSLEKIGYSAFCSIGSNFEIFYPGTKEQWSNIKIGYSNNAIMEEFIHYQSKRIPIIDLVFSPGDTLYIGIGEEMYVYIDTEPAFASYRHFRTQLQTSGDIGYFTYQRPLNGHAEVITITGKSAGKCVVSVETLDGTYIHKEIVAYICQDGWNSFESGKIWLYYTGGRKATGWRKIDDNWFYFDPVTGVMQTGFINDGGTIYYLNNDGILGKGWIQYNGVWYYIKDNGAVTTGWMKSGNDWYYFKDDGAMATGFCSDGSATYYFGTSGSMKTGWQSDGGNWYYFKASGDMVTGWMSSGNSWYYMNSDGVMQTGWIYSGQYYYFKSSGEMATGWIKDDGKWYWFDNDGNMATGWREISGIWEMFADNGEWLYTWDGK